MPRISALSPRWGREQRLLRSLLAQSRRCSAKVAPKGVGRVRGRLSGPNVRGLAGLGWALGSGGTDGGVRQPCRVSVFCSAKQDQLLSSSEVGWVPPARLACGHRQGGIKKKFNKGRYGEIHIKNSMQNSRGLSRSGPWEGGSGLRTSEPGRPHLPQLDREGPA